MMKPVTDFIGERRGNLNVMVHQKSSIGKVMVLSIGRYPKLRLVQEKKSVWVIFKVKI